MNAAPIKNRNPFARASVAEWMAEGKSLPKPNAAGRWVFLLTGSHVKVISRKGVLYFEKGEWAEEEFIVADLDKTPTGNKREFIQIFPIIDVVSVIIN